MCSSDLAYQHTQMAVILLNEYSHLYCTRKVTLQQASLVFFLRPFDMLTWACLAGLTLAIAVGILAIEGLKALARVWYALDVLWSLIGIPLQNRAWPRSMALLIFVLFFASQMYIAYFTSDVLAPLQPSRIQTNRELFELGFKVFRDRSTYAPCGVHNFTRNNLSFTENQFHDPTTPEICVTLEWKDWGPCLAAWPDFGTRRVLTKLAARSIRLIRARNPDPGLHCTTVEEIWDRSVWLTVQFVGHLQSVLKEHVARLIEGGVFPQFWDGIALAGTAREFPVLDPRFVASRLSFNTALLSVIQLYGILVGVAAITLLVEVAHSGCVKARTTVNTGIFSF